MKVAFVGLGQMGRPMALNLLRAYPGLLVHSRNGAAYAQMSEMGAQVADDPQALASCELVYLSLPDDVVVNEVLFGAGGIAQWMKPGSIVVDTSTISYNKTLEIQRRLSV
ncbi:MAG: NAD(P)-binding domain-containing protein, partial [Sweet potato little leaf phytoplasma]|nr:NAD(P)-binding domain-containing protein [Sweet potato little leaf phytoplasma]